MLGLLRKFFVLPLLLLCVAVPYLIFEEGWREKIATQAKSLWNAGPASQASLSVPELADPASTAPQPPLAGFPVGDLAEVFRFDVNEAWIKSRWARISTVTGETQLHGMRVALVTGTQPDDLAGALTYYFDESQQIQRITFHGTTGDARPISDFVMQRYGLKWHSGLGGGLYLTQWNRKPKSALRITHASVIQADRHRQQYDVMMELNRPEYHYQLSPEFAQVLQHDKHTGRWQ